MHFGVIKWGNLAILPLTLIFINDKGLSLGDEKRVLFENLNLTTDSDLSYFKAATEQGCKNCDANDSVKKLGGFDERNFLNFSKTNTSTGYENWMRGKFIKLTNKSKFPKFEGFKEKIPCPVGYNATKWSNFIKTVFNKTTQKFTITNEQPKYINISISNSVKIGRTFLWYGSYDKTPKFECMKTPRQNFTINVTPNVNYLICLVRVAKLIQVNIFDCQPFKTKPLPEDQPWLVKKSIPILVISIFVLFILAMMMGAFILYISVHKNPSLIRGSKRVIEVKRQDKAQILIMPKGYETLPQADSPLSLSMTNDPLHPAISTLSCDTISTVSYVSANQPTPVEILTYRLNKLRELFQRRNNNIPALISSIPRPFSMSLNQRLPAEIDLLFEYEWYTITTTITTTGTTTEECVL